jgi:MinD-like ATPase involved in chromosome partitioning or flagellar assembly
MLGEGHFAGLNEMASGAAGFGEAVHRDRQSEVHVLPSGDVDGDGIALDQLVEVANTMTGSYDFVLFDCGYTGPEGLKLVADGETVVVISCEGVTSHEAAETANHFHAAGFADTIVVRLDPSDREVMPAGAAA